ncbi:MAG: transposase family protein [Mycobacterium sp.]
MRVSTAFNRLLQIPGATVTEVTIGDRDVEVTLRPRARLLRCPCGKRIKAVYDRRRRRWRHLDLACRRLWLVYDIRRLDCPDCGVITEELPWARPGPAIPVTSRTWCSGWPSAPTGPRWPP